MNKTKLFVARDKAFGIFEKGMVHIFGEMPYRYYTGMGMKWKSNCTDIICLGEDAFPELKWEDEPLPVELNEIGLPSTKPDKQDDKEVQEMQSDIDELERICNEMTDEEFLESYKESTKGMRDTTEYDDVFSERPCVMENKYTKTKTEEEVTNSKKTMGLYTIYCTEEQTKKAIELGAPIEVLYTKDDYQQKRPTVAIKGEFVDYAYFVPTAEELIGWLENQGLYFTIDCIGDYVYEVWTKDTDKIVIIINSCVHTRKEATLSAIDVALEHLKENKK